MRIETKRLILRPFEESDYDDLFEFLSQLEKDEFEGYPGITYENGKEHLAYRLGSDEYFAIELKETGKVIGNIYCGKRDFEAREVGYIVISIIKGLDMQAKRYLQLLKNSFRMVRTGFMQNVIPEIYAHGNFLKKQVWNGRLYSTKTYTFIRMKTESRYGKILMCMRRGMNNKFPCADRFPYAGLSGYVPEGKS